uniref:hypothetical protein n=1 Tax=Acinetobacter baumannii TaxID=470 RepID=UPI001C074A6F
TPLLLNNFNYIHWIKILMTEYHWVKSDDRLLPDEKVDLSSTFRQAKYDRRFQWSFLSLQ